jgi:hypothetical protein
MPKLAADFCADLSAMAREYLKERAPNDAIPDNDVIPRYFDSLRRWPASPPRTVWIADNFHCSNEVKAGWELLHTKIIKGEGILPHLSTSHASVTNLDGLLNDWNVHHLHLGTSPHPTKPQFIKRTKQVLLAVITDTDFYAICVLPEHGGWAVKDILESLHRNWPKLLKPYDVKRVKGEDIMDRERQSLRKARVQIATEMSDGTVYNPIGGGVSLSGVSIVAVMRATQALKKVKELQVAVQEQIDNFLVHLRKRGYTDGRDVRATLVGIRPGQYDIFFPEFNFHALVPLPFKSN